MRQELQTFYEKTAAENGRTITKQVSKGPINVLKTSSGPGLIPGSGQRVAWGVLATTWWGRHSTSSLESRDFWLQR